MSNHQPGDTDTAWRAGLTAAIAIVTGAVVGAMLVSIFELLHWPWGEISGFASVPKQVVAGFVHLLREYPVRHPSIFAMQAGLTAGVGSVAALCARLGAERAGWSQGAIIALFLSCFLVAFRGWFFREAGDLQVAGVYLSITGVAIGTIPGVIAVCYRTAADWLRFFSWASSIWTFLVGTCALLIAQYVLPDYAVQGQLALYSSALLTFSLLCAPIRFANIRAVKTAAALTLLTAAFVFVAGEAIPLAPDVNRVAARASIEKGEASQISSSVKSECEVERGPWSSDEAVEYFTEHSHFPRLPSRFDLTDYNILFVVVEATRAASMGLYRDGLSNTPNLRALGEKSWVFEDAYSPSSATSQSLPSILSGLPPSLLRLRVAERPFVARHRAERRQLHRVLRDEMGYFTFGAAYSTFTDLWPPEFDHGLAELAEIESGEFVDFGDKEVNRAAADILRDWKRRSGDNPFWGLVFYGGPHAPYAPDYDGTLRERYREAIRRVDRRIGRMLEELERLEIADDTIVVVTADHGERLGRRGGVGHGLTVYHEGVHVPLLVHVPGFEPQGRRISKPVSSIHVFPWLYLQFPKKSPVRRVVHERLRQFVAPILEMTRTPVVTELVHHHFMRTGLYWEDRAAIYDSFTDRFEWYNRTIDPGLRTDLAPYGLHRAEKDRERIRDYLGFRGCHRKYELDAVIELGGN